MSLGGQYPASTLHRSADSWAPPHTGMESLSVAQESAFDIWVVGRQEAGTGRKESRWSG